jgi:hypothetical protein
MFHGGFHSKIVGKSNMWYLFHAYANYWGFFVVNDGVFFNSCNLQVMKCVLWHFAKVNVDVHNLAHGKNMKGLVSYRKNHNTSSLIKHVLELHSNKIDQCMSLVHMTKATKDHKEATKEKKNSSPFTNHGIFL